MDIDINDFYHYFLLHFFIILKNWHRKRQDLLNIIFANFVVQKISLQWSFITNFVCTHRSSSLNIRVQKLVDIYSITVVFFFIIKIAIWCFTHCDHHAKYDLKDFPEGAIVPNFSVLLRNLKIIFSVSQNQCNIVCDRICDSTLPSII